MFSPLNVVYLFQLNVLLNVWDLGKVWLLFLTSDFFFPLLYLYIMDVYLNDTT